MDQSRDECTAMRRKKSSLTLDLSNSPSSSRRVSLRQQEEGHCTPSKQPASSPAAVRSAVGPASGDLDALKLLSTPECGGLLKLTTAELERFILQPNAPLLASPATPLLFLKPTSEEQEAYARGFMDAMIEIRRKQLNSSFGGLVCLDGTGGAAVTPSFMALTPVSPFAPLTADAVATGCLFPHLMPVNLANTSSRTALASPTSSQRAQSPEAHHPTDPPKAPVKESSGAGLRSDSQAEQIALSNTPPQSPIDMSAQECVKLERKREKNRRAAQKCRTRKLERIARLEHRTQELRQQNARLVQEADEVQEKLLSLRSQIAVHFHNGCFANKPNDA